MEMLLHVAQCLTCELKSKNEQLDWFMWQLEPLWSSAGSGKKTQRPFLLRLRQLVTVCSETAKHYFKLKVYHWVDDG